MYTIVKHASSRYEYTIQTSFSRWTPKLTVVH